MVLHLSPRVDEQDSKGCRVDVAYGSGGWIIGVYRGGTVSEHLEGRGQAEG